MIVSVVIPVYNQLSFTKVCLETLLADPERPAYEIIVVDNASTDGTKEFLEQEKTCLENSGSSDRLILIRNDTNRGVAPAWNQGSQRATGEFLAILNNDIQLSPGWMEGCLWALKHHGFAMVSPFAGTGSLSYDFVGKAEKFIQKNHGRIWDEFDFCAVVMPRKTYVDLGPFDENFLVGGYEDTDYSYRLKAKGLRYGVTGAAYIHHFGSQTLGDFKKRGDKHAAHNKNYFIQKWGEDPSGKVGTLPWKVRKTWRKLKMALGYM